MSGASSERPLRHGTLAVFEYDADVWLWVATGVKSGKASSEEAAQQAAESALRTFLQGHLQELDGQHVEQNTGALGLAPGAPIDGGHENAYDR